jgi:hypothetical protein
VEAGGPPCPLRLLLLWDAAYGEGRRGRGGGAGGSVQSWSWSEVEERPGNRAPPLLPLLRAGYREGRYDWLVGRGYRVLARGACLRIRILTRRRSLLSTGGLPRLFPGCTTRWPVSLPQCGARCSRRPCTDPGLLARRGVDSSKIVMEARSRGTTTRGRMRGIAVSLLLPHLSVDLSLSIVVSPP